LARLAEGSAGTPGDEQAGRARNYSPRQQLEGQTAKKAFQGRARTAVYPHGKIVMPAVPWPIARNSRLLDGLL